MPPQNAAPVGALPPQPSRQTSGLGLAGIAAFVLMALALGWLIWFQAQRGSSRVSPEALMTRAAETYAQTGDVAQARELLAGLEVEQQAQLIARLEADSPDETTRQQLAALREALQLPRVTPSLWDSLFRQRLILISFALAAVPLLGALAVSLLPWFQRMGQRLAPDASLAQAAEVTPTANAEEQPNAEPPPSTDTVSANAAPAISAQATPPPQTDPSQAAAEPHIQAILSSVFESETDSIKYEVLLRELKDIQASELLRSSQKVVRQLRARSAPAVRKEV